MQNFLKQNFFLLVAMFLATAANAQTANRFKLISSAFEEGKPVPVKYTCDGTNVAPPLSWSGFPEKSKSFAIIMDDPDAPVGTWVHWVLYNIPVSVTSLEENHAAANIQAIEGLNSWNDKGYNGPCPPGRTHRYVFKLYALDTVLPPKEGMSKEELLEAMNGHILGETALTGLFRVE